MPLDPQEVRQLESLVERSIGITTEPSATRQGYILGVTLVEDVGVNVQPVGASVGARYVTGSAPAGGWAPANAIVRRTSALAWASVVPTINDAFLVRRRTDRKLYGWNGTAWIAEDAAALAAAASAAGFDFTQSGASSTWTINHNLGRRPVVQLFTVGGVRFQAEIIHMSVNQAVVNLSSAIAGTARCV